LVDVGDGVGRDYRAGEGLVEKVSAESMMAIGAGEGGASSVLCIITSFIPFHMDV